MVRRARLPENRIFVVLGMRCSEVPAAKIDVVLLLAVIGQRLSRNLSAGVTPLVGEYREEQGIHAGTLLKHIKDSFSPFVDKRNCSHLNANHFGGHSSMSWSWHRQEGAGTNGYLQEFATIYVKCYGLFVFFVVEPMPKELRMSFGLASPGGFLCHVRTITCVAIRRTKKCTLREAPVFARNQIVIRLACDRAR